MILLAMPLLALADAALVAWAAVHLHGPIGAINAAHVALTFAALGLCLVTARRADRRFDPSQMVIGSAFGPCGIFGMALAKAIHRPQWSVRARPRAGSSAGHAGGETAAPEFDFLYRALEDRITYPEPEQVESLSVTLRFGDQAARQNALQAVVRSFEPRLAPLIAVALSDKDQAIRALAAAASAQISHDVALAFAEMEAKIAAGVALEEVLPVVLSVASHGCHDVLLPRTQQLILCRASASYLASHLPDAVSREMSRDMRAALAELEKVLAPVTVPQAQAAKEPAGLLLDKLA